MPSIDRAKRERSLKLVYWGVGLGGKTTTMQYVHARTPVERRTKMESFADETSRSMWFSFSPQTVDARLTLVTNPGAVFYDSSRATVLADADGVIFVVDSQVERFEANVEKLEELVTTLASHDKRLDEIAFVVAYNKRDLSSAASIEVLERALNPHRAPYFETIAHSGDGVFDTLRACVNAMMDRVQR